MCFTRYFLIYLEPEPTVAEPTTTTPEPTALGNLNIRIGEVEAWNRNHRVVYIY